METQTKKKPKYSAKRPPEEKRASDEQEKSTERAREDQCASKTRPDRKTVLQYGVSTEETRQTIREKTQNLRMAENDPRGPFRFFAKNSICFAPWTPRKSTPEKAKKARPSDLPGCWRGAQGVRDCFCALSYLASYIRMYGVSLSTYPLVCPPVYTLVYSVACLSTGPQAQFAISAIPIYCVRT